MDIRKVKKLIELLEESNLNELEITEGDDSVRISRGVNAANYSSPIAPAITHKPLSKRFNKYQVLLLNHQAIAMLQKAIK